MGIANLGENMNAKDWISDPKVIEKSKKGYAHFDLRMDISKASGYVTNPDKVAHHGFYPFIHYVMKINKYNKQKGKKSKEREICYAAHIDRCIYQFYSAILNESYNLYLDKEGIDSVSVAYRTNLQKNWFLCSTNATTRYWNAAISVSAAMLWKFFPLICMKRTA